MEMPIGCDGQEAAGMGEVRIKVVKRTVFFYFSLKIWGSKRECKKCTLKV